MSKKEESFIRFDREVITKIKDTTEAIILGYIIHEQISSYTNNSTLRKITDGEIASKFKMSKKQAGRVKTKLYEKNLLVEDSPVPNPRIGKLVWNEDDKSFDISFTKIVKEIGLYGKEIEFGRNYYYLTSVDETTSYFDYGFVKVDKEWFENPNIDNTTKYWVIFFKAFEPREGWTPTWKGISKDGEGEKKLSCWAEDTVRDAYYRIRDEGWVHNDKEVDIQLDYQRVQGKSYSIDFNQVKVEKVSDKKVKELTKDVLPAEEQIAEIIEKEVVKDNEVPEDLDDFLAVVNI